MTIAQLIAACSAQGAQQEASDLLVTRANLMKAELEQALVDMEKKA